MPPLTPGSGFQARFSSSSDWRVASVVRGRQIASTANRTTIRTPRSRSFGESHGFLGQRGLRSQLFGATRDAKPWARASASGGSYGIPKTIEYLAPSNLTAVATDTTLGAATVYSTTVDCRIIEAFRRSTGFLSVKMIWTFAGGWSANNGITGTRVTCKLGGNTAISYDRSHASTQVNGRPNFYAIETDVTDVFRNQYPATDGYTTPGVTATATIAVSTTLAQTVQAHTCKFVITYAFDLAMQASKAHPVTEAVGYWYTKTIRIPVQSHLAGLTTSQQEIGADGTLGKTNQLPNLSTFLPEGSAFIYSVFLETTANTRDTAVTDFQPFVQIGAAAEVGRAVLERGNWTANSCLWRDHYDLAAFTTAAASINWRADVTDRLSNICAFIVVTYTYRADTTSIVLLEGHWPLLTSVGHGESGTGIVLVGFTSAVVIARMMAMADIPEPNPTIVQSAVVFNYDASGTNPALSLRAGTQSAYRPYLPPAAIGMCPFVHRTDDGWSLQTGINHLSIDFYNDQLANANKGHVVDGYAHVLYTVDVTGTNYDAQQPTNPMGVGAQTMEGAGGGTDQIHPERCTRVVCFSQHQVEEAALIQTWIDTYADTPPRPAMLGDFWKVTGAYMEASLLTGENAQDFQYGWEQLSNEFGGSGMTSFPNLTNTGNNTTFQSMPKRLAITDQIKTESDQPYLADPEKVRRQWWTAITAGNTLVSWAWWFTVQNHKFLIVGNVKENNAYVAPDIDVDIWSRYEADASAVNPRREPQVKKIATIKLIDNHAAKNFFVAYAHESYRDVWASTEATTYPSKSAVGNPGGGSDFSITTYTAPPGGGGLTPPVVGPPNLR